MAAIRRRVAGPHRSVTARPHNPHSTRSALNAGTSAHELSGAHSFKNRTVPSWDVAKQSTQAKKRKKKKRKDNRKLSPQNLSLPQCTDMHENCLLKDAKPRQFLEATPAIFHVLMPSRLDVFSSLSSALCIQRLRSARWCAWRPTAGMSSSLGGGSLCCRATGSSVATWTAGSSRCAGRPSPSMT